jgi:RNA polymerase sigma-70 factor (ECF subfamily)
MVTLSPASSAAACELLGRGGVALSSLPGESEGDLGDRIDTELMRLYRDTGSRDAFEELYRRSSQPVLDWLRWLLRERRLDLDCAELVQDTYVNVYRYANSFRPDRAASFRCWVRTIAANCVRRARRRRHALRLVSLGETDLDPLDPRGVPHLRAVEREETRSLREAWILFAAHYASAYRQLSHRDRLALELVEVDGLSYAEAGARLRVGSSNMKMIMLRARRRLAARMRAAMGGAQDGARAA